MVKESPSGAAAITTLVTSEFDRLAVRYVIVGSLASSLHGLPRATNDADVVAALQLDQVEDLVKALSGTFYIDADMIKDAIRRRSEFNIIHLATMFKVGACPRGRGDFLGQLLAERAQVVLLAQVDAVVPQDRVDVRQVKEEVRDAVFHEVVGA